MGPSRAIAVAASAYMDWTEEARTPQTVVAASAHMDWTEEAWTPQGNARIEVSSG